MKLKLTAPELTLLGVGTLLLLVALVGPAITQPNNYHHFADQRAWLGLPFATDVLSNLPFALWGVLGLHQLWGRSLQRLGAGQRGTATLFFAGLILTALCSGWYHWQPDDARLVLDRLGMVVAFAGLLGLAAAGRISARAGMALALAVLALGPLSVAAWAISGNLTPWVALQLGGMGIVLWLASRAPLPGALPVRWGAVILIYALAKLLEQGDHQVYELLGHAISGHSLKHLLAGLAAWPVYAAILAQQHRPAGQLSGPKTPQPWHRLS